MTSSPTGLTAGVPQTPGKFGAGHPAVADPIVQGGLLTAAHTDVARFFVTLPRARELVIKATAMGPGGEATVLEQGRRPVGKHGVAQQAIEMRGRDDIEIVFTGFREGEKPHEGLFGLAEGQRQTRHGMIDAVPVPPLGIAEVRASAMCWGQEQGAA